MSSTSIVKQSYETDEEGKELKRTGIACDRARQALKECIKNSDCVQIHARSARDCLRADDGTVPYRCATLLDTFSACKRSLVDMRSRFRGRKGDI